jgi:hypothetical protein
METQYTPLLKECATFIKDVGFPIFVALWVLIITTRETKYLTKAINRLTSAFEKANIKINSN